MKYWTWIIAILISMKSSAQIITTFAGGGSSGLGDGGPATSAQVNYPACGAFDAVGNYYFIESIGGPRVRMVDKVGIIHTVAGTGIAGFSGDSGPATMANIRPQGLTVDAVGNIYIGDYYNNRIRKVDVTTHIISTIAGTGIAGFFGDNGPATDAHIMPSGICLDPMGNIFFVDGGGYRVRKINTSGIITTIAGNGTGGTLGDGGPATSAQLAMNGSLCLDLAGDLYLACDSKIRKVDMITGIISTYAGTGIHTYIGDGMPATAAQFDSYMISFDTSENNLYISDIANDRVHQIDATGLFHLIAGTGIQGFSGDMGPATAATLYNPQGVAIDPCGNLYIADDANHRIRKVTFNPPTIPTVAITGITSASVGATVTVNATVTGAGSSYTIKWMNKGIQFATTAVPTVTYTKDAGIDTITARVVPAVTYCYDSTTSAPHIVSESTVSVSYLSQGVFSVYPNPGHNTLSISGGEVINSVTITNLVGEALINEQPDKEAIQISIAHLPWGMYLLRVNDVYVQRFMKE